MNQTTPLIFEQYPDIESLSFGTTESLFPWLKNISYPNNKTKNLIGMARMRKEDFNGEIPMSINDLIKLPGAGRKTANVITSVVDQQPNMAVKTHVLRVANRIVLAKATTPLGEEMQLIKNLPIDLIYVAHHWLILHGRYVCVSGKPKCNICGLRDVCKYYATIV